MPSLGLFWSTSSTGDMKEEDTVLPIEPRCHHVEGYGFSL